jgi:hypothetical protein
MKYTIILLLLLTSCYTKKQAINKFCKSDSISVIMRDTIVTQTIKTDTSFFYDIDTVLITKENLSIRYVKFRDSVYLTGKCKGDSIFITKEVKVQTLCPSISSYSFNEWLEGQPFWVGFIVMVILIFAILYLIQTIVSAANKYASK